MLNWTLLLGLLFGFVANCPADSFDPFAGLGPVAVLIQEDPWALVMGADTPRIAIYENGEVIYSRNQPKGKGKIYFHAEIGLGELAALSDRMAALADIPGLKTSYTFSDETDQGHARFYLRTDNKEIVTSVYGLHSGHQTSAHGNESVPAPLLRLYDYLNAVGFSESTRWHPAYVEAMIWPYDYAPDNSVTWPPSWPGIHSTRARQRSDNAYSIFLDGSQQDALSRFISAKPEKAAVEIDGQKWAIDSRPVFPSEPVWRKAFARITGD